MPITTTETPRRMKKLRRQILRLCPMSVIVQPRSLVQEQPRFRDTSHIVGGRVALDWGPRERGARAEAAAPTLRSRPYAAFTSDVVGARSVASIGTTFPLPIRL